MCVRIPGSELTPSPPAARRRSTQREDVVRVLRRGFAILSVSSLSHPRVEREWNTPMYSGTQFACPFEPPNRYGCDFDGY
ncbi:hypothetical protein BHE74_00027310 [Ensete ventricosum]|nr:hypothetical protein BHE74_00027310 [Ensete ventricosum]